MSDHVEEVIGERFTLMSKNYFGPAHLPSHVHDHAHIAIILEGRIVDHSEGGTVVLEPHTAIFRPPNYRHSNQLLSESTRVLVAAIAPSTIPHFCPLFGGMPTSVVLPFTAFGLTVIRLLEEWAIRDAGTPLAADALLTELVVFAARAHRQESRAGRPSWMTSVLAWVEARIGERIRVSDVAAFAGLSVTQFSAAFVRYQKVPFSIYLRHRRLTLAVTALMSSGEQLVEIAGRLGFVDQAHLTRLFRKEYGTTPARFRQRFRGLGEKSMRAGDGHD